MSKGYFELYSKLVDDYKNHNKYNKNHSKFPIPMHFLSYESKEAPKL